MILDRATPEGSNIGLKSPNRPSNRRQTLASYSILYEMGRVMSDEILTLPELAKLLKVAEKTVYTMAQTSQLPAFKVRGQWRFKHVDIDRWIEQQKEASRDERRG